MELAFREWVDQQEAISFDDIKQGAEYGLHQTMHSSGWPAWAKERQRGYRNGLQMAQKSPGFTLADNPYLPTDVNHYNGWIAGFNYARKKAGFNIA